MILPYIGLLCLTLPGLLALVSGFLFVFRRDWIWQRARRWEGIPADFERSPRWDRQMIFVGLAFLVMGLLCTGFSLIGVVFG